MELKQLSQNIEGCTIIAFVTVYAIVNCYILFKYYREKEQRLYMQKVMLAFVSFLLLGLQELFFYFYLFKQAGNNGNIAILNIKLLIFSAIFTVIIFQSWGFIEEGVKVCFKYQLGWMLMLLILDSVCYFCGVRTTYYVAILSGISLFVLSYLMYKFLSICLNRYDTIIKTLSKENLVIAFRWLCIMLLVSYIVFISLMALDNIFISIATLLLIFAVHMLFVYRKKLQMRYFLIDKRNYIVLQEDGSKNLLMEEKVSADFKIIQRLVLYFEEEKPYLDKEIKLADVARKIYTNKTYLSRALNQRMYRNFNQFVNYYRVREACYMFLSDPKMSLNDICYNSGFKNLSSFSSSFSLNLRYTPSEWCKEVRRKIQNNEQVSIKDYFIE